MPRVSLVQFRTDSIVANMPSAREGCATSRNFSYQRDIKYVFKPNNWILSSIGIWPFAIRSIGRYVSNVTIAFNNFIMGFTIVPCLLYIVYDMKDIIIKLKLSGILAFAIIAMIKYFILMMRRPKIQRCIEYVKHDWWQVTFESDREMMLKHAVIGRNLMMLGALLMYSSGFIWFVVLPVNFENSNQTNRPFVFPIYSEFRQIQISPMYEIVYIVQYLCTYSMYSTTVGAHGLIAMFVIHACGQIQMIISRLRGLLEAESPDRAQNIHQRIAIIVKTHVRIVRFAATVEEALQEVCLVEFTSCICTICLLEYYCIVEWQEDNKSGLVIYFLFFVSFCFNAYILCYVGELLMEKSSEIGSTCYMINWYQLSPKSARNLIVIIIMSSHSIKLSPGGIIDLSFSTFGNVLKTSLAYLSFLRTVLM